MRGADTKDTHFRLRSLDRQLCILEGCKRVNCIMMKFNGERERERERERRDGLDKDIENNEGPLRQVHRIGTKLNRKVPIPSVGPALHAEFQSLASIGDESGCVTHPDRPEHV